MHGVRGLQVKVRHCLGVGQDTGGDHEGQHVHRDQQHCAHREREQQALETVQWNFIRSIFITYRGNVIINLNLDHGNHRKTG